MRRLLGDDRGYATILGAFAIAVLMTVAVAVIYIGAAVLARHRAQSAADLAALAAAVDHVAAADDPCGTAEKYTRDQATGAHVRRCDIDDDVVITVGIELSLGPFGTRDAVATARAGPVD